MTRAADIVACLLSSFFATRQKKCHLEFIYDCQARNTAPSRHSPVSDVPRQAAAVSSWYIFRLLVVRHCSPTAEWPSTSTSRTSGRQFGAGQHHSPGAGGGCQQRKRQCAPFPDRRLVRPGDDRPELPSRGLLGWWPHYDGQSAFYLLFKALCPGRASNPGLAHTALRPTATSCLPARVICAAICASTCPRVFYSLRIIAASP